MKVKCKVIIGKTFMKKYGGAITFGLFVDVEEADLPAVSQIFKRAGDKLDENGKPLSAKAYQKLIEIEERDDILARQRLNNGGA